MALNVRTKEAIKTALAMTIAYGIALAMNWESPHWAGFAVAFISLSTVGQSLNKGLMRMAGTLLAAAFSLTLIALFPQERWWFFLILSSFVGLCTYLMGGSGRQYFWNVAGFVSLIVCMSSVPATENAFDVAMLRILETGLGILVYTLITVLVWPTGTRQDLDVAIRKLAAPQHALYRQYRGLLHGQGTAEDTRPLRTQEVRKLGQFSQALAAARTDSYEVWEVRRQWQQVQDLSAAVMENLERWRKAFHVREVETLPRKLAAWAKAVDADTLPGTTPQQVQALTTYLQALTYRVQELMDAREYPQAKFLVGELLTDVRAWRLRVQEAFGAWSRNLTPASADVLRERLTRRLGQLERRIEETMNKAAEGELSDQERERLYRLLGAYRGLSEAGVEYARTAEGIDWGPWRETRF